MEDARAAKGLTQEQVASALGTTPNTVSRWESGEMTPRRASGAALERLYELPPGTLTAGVPVRSMVRETTPLYAADAAAGVLWAAEQMSETVTRLIRQARTGEREP